MSQNNGYSVIGTRPVRHDGIDKVTGDAKYGADIFPQGVLYGKILRSPYAHAMIKSIDVSAAKKLQGVKAIVTGNDLLPPGEDKGIKVGEATKNLKYIREATLATKKVLYVGHPVAAVAADNPHIAEEAISLIKVTYEQIAHSLTALDGIRKDAAILHPNTRSTTVGNGTKPTNIEDHIIHEKGDIEKGFAEADIIIEREFNTATVHQGYIEPHNTTVKWTNDGRVQIWCSTQGPFDLRDETATILGIPVSKVKLTPMEIGGGFGGKFSAYASPVAALLSRKSGHPVRIIHTRSEDLEATGPTPGSYIKCKIGASKEGKIIAAYAYLAYEAGAYPDSMVASGAKCIFASYEIPNAKIEAVGVHVNKPSTAAYRAPGATNAAFASETIVDEICTTLKIDPVEFRLQNASKEGTRRVDGPIFPKIGCVEVLEAIKNHPHYQAPLEKNVGRGVAIGFWFNHGGQSSCTINVNSDGTCGLVEGSPDIGGTRTSVAMQAAEVLGIPVEDFNPMVVDTDTIGYTEGTGGSRTTFATGWAAIEAARDVKSQMIQRAAEIWDVDQKSVNYENGIIKSAKHQMSFKELAGELGSTGGLIVGKSTITPAGEGGGFAGNIVDLKIDPETGKIDILRFTAIQDVGTAVHPSYVEGQMQGGSVQGIGWALNEEYFMTNEGRMANSTLLDYRMPIAMDVPLIDTVIVEVPNPGHPYGVRGVGEVNIVPPPAAIANAINNATGLRMTELPMKPNKLMELIWENKQK
ncbi:MAG: xanthine dehydrogenase family protein molybdopterin-binding subunit [SAR202 cluster bacterium]|nr:xanthine dehydrogenase family protein molybdopterin-binding subunit [SAR202 cluster bacterium]